MILRAVFMLVLVMLLAGILDAWRLHFATAQDVLPTPIGQLGGREPLPTPAGAPTEPVPSPTHAPADHLLVGAWSLTYPDEDLAPDRLVLAADGLAGFVGGDGAHGAGVWAETGPRRGVLAIAVRADGAPVLTLMYGTIMVGSGDDEAAVDYTTAAIDEAGSPSERTGTFQAMARRAGEA